MGAADPSGSTGEGARWRLTLAWDGRRYQGWQWQPGGGSIQEVVEQALGRSFGLDAPIRATASGRTDAGVHALAQVVGFQAPAPRSPRSMVAALNQQLPDDIAAIDAAPAPPDFDPRRWTRRKLYRYRILNRHARCPFRAGQVWRWGGPLDAEAMAEGARALVGRHDFTSFRAVGCSAAHAVRNIESAEVRRVDDEIQVEFVGNGFLRHQVRIMVGALMEVGLKRQPPTWVADVLAGRDRSRAGRTAPAEGLWLVRVELGDGPRSGAGDEGDDEG